MKNKYGKSIPEMFRELRREGDVELTKYVDKKVKKWNEKNLAS